MSYRDEQRETRLKRRFRDEDRLASTHRRASCEVAGTRGRKTQPAQEWTDTAILQFFVGLLQASSAKRRATSAPWSVFECPKP